ncbi:MFS transporter [Paenibacillus physcomitrellae]|uniref:MFS transporter n=1 Tax=Paenibacillus physcomitrellae TaxID=1619311 RepID=A0ABQ1FR70_9BACL|nr:MFS transporter [Paenibacillus physcomitrellae]GGA27627.1 MFS transporter [Paenibacillus physcomitrellae]
MGFIQTARWELNKWSGNIKLFFLANILYQIGTGMFGVLYNLYIQELGYNDAMNGRVVSIQSLATALLFIPIGLWGDRASRKKILIVGAMFSGAAFLLRSFVSGESGLIGLAVFTGLFASFFQVLSIPFLAENVKPKERLRMFSYFSSLVLASQVIGSMGGGLLADGLQAAGFSTLASLQTVLALGGSATFAAFIPMLFVRELSAKGQASADAGEELKSHESVKSNTDESDQPRETAAEFKTIGKFVIAQLLIGFGSGLVVPYLNLYFTNRFSASLSLMGILISLGQVMTIVSMLIGPTLARKVGQVKAVVIFQMLSLPFLLLTGFTHWFVLAAVSFLFRQALMNAANPIQSSIMIDRIADKRRGIANSLTQTAFMLGWATMGPVQSRLVTGYGSYWGYAITFSITGCLYVAASLMYFFMFRKSSPADARSAVEM